MMFKGVSIFSVSFEELSSAEVFPIGFIGAVILLLTEGPQACNGISLLSTLSSGPQVLVQPIYN